MRQYHGRAVGGRSRYLRADREQGFDLPRAPLLQLALHRLAGVRYRRFRRFPMRCWMAVRLDCSWINAGGFRWGALCLRLHDDSTRFTDAPIGRVASGKPVEIALPVETARLAESPLPGYALAIGLCSTCHSAEYVQYQPNANRAYWRAATVKMPEGFRGADSGCGD